MLPQVLACRESAERAGGVAFGSVRPSMSGGTTAGRGTKPLVSVVICNYNYGRFLDAAIRSVLAQTYKPVEVIVVDDGSTDGSAGVLQRQPPAVVRLHTPRSGQIGALWAGVQACHGDYVCLMDSDDVWHPDKVSRVAASFRTFPETGWVRHKLAVTDQDLRILGPAVPAFAAFMDLAVSLWPEPVLAFPPCAATLSPDESVLLGLLAAAAAGDRAAADRLAGELLDPAARDRLWRAAMRVTDALAAA